MNQETPAPSADTDGLLKSKRFLGLHIDKQNFIKLFFGGNAAIAILVLFLIMFSLLREGAGFLPTYRWELEVYRKAGLEFADFIKKPLTENQSLYSRLNRALNAEFNTISKESKDRRDAAYFLKRHVEDATQLQREPLEEALEKGDVAPEILTSLRQAVTTATSGIVVEEKIPDIFSQEEKELLRGDLRTLQPDVTELPPFIKSLTEKAAEQDAAAREKYATFVDATEAFELVAEPITDLHDEMKEMVLKTKEAATQQHMSEDAKAQLLAAAAKAKTEAIKQKFIKDAEQTITAEIDYQEAIQPVLAKLPDYEKLIPPYVEALKKAMSEIPQELTTKEAKTLVKSVRDDFKKHIEHIEASPKQMQEWKWDKPIPLLRAGTAFLFGGDWISNSSWQDFYGVIPLLTGSCMIALIALVVALPFSVAAAIYTNQFASAKEQEFIKPLIEFIQAIPSVVLGFIGISLVGDMIKDTSQIPWLQWLPGFPIQERLNMFNAGLLLALMAIPTMFSLAEDAIQNVPRAFSEASEALGATKLQTVFRVIVPSAVSGILAAVLLGLGRIIGETMVVLLVAGNRIAIPDFSDGFGTIFQPAHTLTGIIAQELGEVSQGSVHWQALFMVGILLFLISLFINWASRLVVKKFQLPKI